MEDLSIRFLSSKEVSQCLGISQATLRRHLKSSSDFPRAVRIAGLERWRYDELMAWIDRQPRVARPAAKGSTAPSTGSKSSARRS